MNAIMIDSPGEGNPCYPVSPEGRIVAEGHYSGDSIDFVEAAVLAGFVDPLYIPDPGSISYRVRGAVSGYSWLFDIDSGEDRRVPYAQGYCAQNTLVVWGKFIGSSVIVPQIQYFLGQDSSDACSGVLGSLTSPISSIAPLYYEFEPYPAPPESELWEAIRRSGADKLILTFDRHQSVGHNACWSWRFKFDEPVKVANERYLTEHHFVLETFRKGKQVHAALKCDCVMAWKDEEAKVLREVQRFCWSTREWCFTHANLLNPEPHANEPTTSLMIVRPAPPGAEAS